VDSVPEDPEKYPEYKMFSPLPAFGLYVRYVRHLHAENVRCTSVTPDARPAMCFEDVQD